MLSARPGNSWHIPLYEKAWLLLLAAILQGIETLKRIIVKNCTREIGNGKYTCKYTWRTGVRKVDRTACQKIMHYSLIYYYAKASLISLMILEWFRIPGMPIAANFFGYRERCSSLPFCACMHASCSNHLYFARKNVSNLSVTEVCSSHSIE